MSDGDNPFGSLPGGLEGLLQQATQMQAKIKTAQERANDREVTGEAAGGLVKVTCNGKLEILSVHLDPIVIDKGEKDMLEDLITAAANSALTRARELIQSELGPLAQMLESTGIKL